MPDATRETAGVLAPPPLIYAAALGLGLVAEWLLPGASLPPGLVWAGVAVIAVGIAIDAWFTITLRRARTPVNPYSPTRALVTSGPYRFSRNPAYVGMAVIFVGIALAAQAPWALPALPIAILVVDRGVIQREEPYLERLFGAEYERYRSRVRRWL